MPNNQDMLNSQDMIALTDVLEANSDLMMADLEGEAVLLNMHTGRYFGLNEVGTSIWSRIAETCTVAEVIDSLQKEYDVPGERLNEDVLAFLETMEKRNLIHVITAAHV